MKMFLRVMSLGLGVVGMVMIYSESGAMVAGGVFLMLWGNNIQMKYLEK